jgi:gas vesicle protein
VLTESNEEKQWRKDMRHKEFWFALSLGALAGAVLALLYAPQSGEKTRKQLKRGLEDAGDALEDAGDYLKEQAERLAKEAQKLVGAGKDQFNDAVDAATSYASDAVKSATKTVKSVQQRLV